MLIKWELKRAYCTFFSRSTRLKLSTDLKKIYFEYISRAEWLKFSNTPIEDHPIVYINLTSHLHIKFNVSVYA